jgi:predicted Zn-dependent protease
MKRKTIRSCVVEMVKASPNGKVPAKEILQKLRAEFPNVKWLQKPDDKALSDLVNGYPERYPLKLVKEDAEAFITISSTPPTTPKSKSVKGK